MQDEKDVEDGASPVGEPKDDFETGIPTHLTFQNPFDFPMWKKWLITILLAGLTTVATFASSVFSATIPITAKEFHTSETVMILGVSLYVLGFALGPLLWGPLSEVVGRKTPIFGGFFIFAILQIPTALAKNLPGILICRLLSGCFAAAPVVLVSATYADFWQPAQRGIASAVYSIAVYVGPTLGPIIGSIVTRSHLGWRWTSWLTLIMATAVGVPAFAFVPETFAPVLKRKAAKKLQKSTEESIVPSSQVLQRKTKDHFVRTYLVKPLLMLAFEPLLDVMTLYISLIYGIMYLQFYSIPYSFMSNRHWSPTTATLPFISMLLGVFAGCAFLAIYTEKYYKPRLVARKKVLPEDRLPPVMLGGILLPLGLFWFAWTSENSVSWVAQVFSLFTVGAGILLIFSCGVVFLVDVYLPSAASALAANTCVRSFVAAGLPLAAPKMFRTLGVAWATSILGFLCVALMPAPFMFYHYGERLRKNSRFAYKPG